MIFRVFIPGSVIPGSVGTSYKKCKNLPGIWEIWSKINWLCFLWLTVYIDRVYWNFWSISQYSVSMRCFLFVLLAASSSYEAAFIGHPARLLCGKAKGKSTDWMMYKISGHSQRQGISLNGTLSDTGKYTIDGSSLIINEVKASDAGIYTCGHGRQLYHKLRLNVSGVWTFCCYCLSNLCIWYWYHLRAYVCTCMVVCVWNALITLKLV